VSDPVADVILTSGEAVPPDRAGAAGPGGRPLRRDAARNRARILQAAAEVFAKEGLDASMDAVAATAGVGVGTVYRHFPRRDELLRGLFDARIDEVLALLGEAQADPDPWHGLTQFLERSLEIQVEDRALAQVLADDELQHRLVRRGSQDIKPAVERLLARALEAGLVRPDVTSVDVALVRSMVLDVAERTRDLAPELWRRMLAICIDGLRPHGTELLPGSPLGFDDVKSVLHRALCRPPQP